MIKTYLFDWGDTLMVDFPDASGKMCNWPEVQAVSGAKEVLASLTKKYTIYIATNAADSAEHEVQLAFERAGLSEYISGYFCKANLGLAKGTADFYTEIVHQLKLQPEDIVMVGDTLATDVIPALDAGLDAIWFNPTHQQHPQSVELRQIQDLRELCG
jgi:FMN phosphatase YigB (HAD superfamily)